MAQPQVFQLIHAEDQWDPEYVNVYIKDGTLNGVDSDGQIMKLPSILSQQAIDSILQRQVDISAKFTNNVRDIPKESNNRSRTYTQMGFLKFAQNYMTEKEKELSARLEASEAAPQGTPAKKKRTKTVNRRGGSRQRTIADPPKKKKKVGGGKGKGGKGLGTGGAKRHRKVLRDNIQGITKGSIRRLARRGGVKRLSGLIYEETRGVLNQYMIDIIHDAVTYTEHAKRRTVSVVDVLYALKRHGRTLYGFGG
jgi:histone H4